LRSFVQGFVAVSVVAAIGCATGDRATWNKAGATQASLDGDAARCNSFAWQRVPAYRPPQYPTTTYQTNCSGDRYSVNCKTEALDGGRNVPLGMGGLAGMREADEQRQVDAARQSTFMACMYDLGWSRETATVDARTSAPNDRGSALKWGDVGAGCLSNRECNEGLICNAQMRMCVGPPLR
jgi:hypothetical protein